MIELFNVETLSFENENGDVYEVSLEKTLSCEHYSIVAIHSFVHTFPRDESLSFRA